RLLSSRPGPTSHRLARQPAPSRQPLKYIVRTRPEPDGVNVSTVHTNDTFFYEYPADCLTSLFLLIMNKHNRRGPKIFLKHYGRSNDREFIGENTIPFSQETSQQSEHICQTIKDSPALKYSHSILNILRS